MSPIDEEGIADQSLSIAVTKKLDSDTANLNIENEADGEFTHGSGGMFLDELLSKNNQNMLEFNESPE